MYITKNMFGFQNEFFTILSINSDILRIIPIILHKLTLFAFVSMYYEIR